MFDDDDDDNDRSVAGLIDRGEQGRRNQGAMVSAGLRSDDDQRPQRSTTHGPRQRLERRLGLG